MSMAFNADEVFEMAEEIERNGARFYREAAAKAPNRRSRRCSWAMASMEDAHLRTFHEMRETLTEQEKGERVRVRTTRRRLYLQALADSKGFEGMKSSTQS